MKTRAKMVGMGAAILFLGLASESLLAQSRDRYNQDERNKREQVAIPRMEPKQRVDQRSNDRNNHPERNTQNDNRNSDRGSNYQSQDRGRGNDMNHENRRDNNQRETYHHQPVRYKYQYWNDHRTRRVTYNHHRYNRPVWAPVYGYRYNTRYIYYRDYNLYYDCHRNVFVVWTGGNWVVTSHVPDFMYQVNFSNARMQGVDYWEDDFDYYLRNKRPGYISIYSER